jgi:transglutaminase-like putative cysteine protease
LSLSTLAARPPVLPVREAAAGGPVLPFAPARAGVLLALTAFAGLHWMWLLEPPAPGRAWEAVGVAAMVVAGLLVAARLHGAARWLAAGVVALAGCALALLAGGLADEYLRPDRWGELLSGVGRGLEALPGVRVPYRGIDEWTRIVIGAGGTMLAAVAAALAFWPRRERVGFPAAALILLVTLYAVPAVVLDFGGEFLRGAVLALLMLAFLRLEKLRVRDARAAATLAGAVAILALAAAPALDGRQPWWDYERWALETAGTKTVTFSWDHDYSPLDWPRDGRELLRVKARIPSYWKAANLDLFDGRTWRQDPRERGEEPGTQLPDSVLNLQRWRQQIQVTLRNLRSQTFVTAGIATAVQGQLGFPVGGGIFNAASELNRGDSYTADVYTPRPSERQLRDAGPTYEQWLGSYREIFVGGLRRGALADDPAGQRGVPIRVSFPSWGEPGVPSADRYGELRRAGTDVLADSGMARIWALSQRLKRGTTTPFAYVQRVEAYMHDNFAYSESPPAASETLDGFLFVSKIGFCQQYSGAEALLLRMAGIPARVATGFTSGSFDTKAKEYVVRDLDAHSWVEAWFPGYGWVTRDPTPAAAPARSQPGDNRATLPSGRAPGAPDLRSDRVSDPKSGKAVDGGGPGWVTLTLLGLLATSVLTAGALLARRRRARRPPAQQRPMLEFERALRRARLDRGPGTTLSGMERRYSGWPGAAGYIRALRDQRYAGRPAAPTPEQRRGLRAALARDAGLLRSWWALPPRTGRRT